MWDRQIGGKQMRRVRVCPILVRVVAGQGGVYHDGLSYAAVFEIFK